MKFSDIKTILKAHILAGDTRTVPIILGSPGCGKSALGYELAKDPELGFEHFDDLNFSVLDTPDAAGLALIGDQSSDALKFKYPPQLARMRTGRNLLILDEIGDSVMAMQNLARRWQWNREVNGCRLSDETFIIMMSNRSKDKSGAGRLSGKIKNAVTQYTLESNLDDWVNNFAMPHGKNPLLIQFLRFRPGLLDMYDPDADCSPTPRQWDLVDLVPSTLPTDLFFADVAGKVGEGPAAEFTAFRKIYLSLVSFEDVVLSPKGTPIPEDLAALYATVGSLAHNTTVGNVDRVAEYVDRLSPDFGVMYWMDTWKKTPAVKGTKAFVKWATANANVVMN
jgi:hypothetical protein